MQSLDAKLKATLKGWDYVEGVRLAYPMGTLIVRGKKRISLHKKRIERWYEKPLLLIENDHALALVRFTDERMVTPAIAKAMVKDTMLLDSEFEEWYHDRDFLWAYRVEVLEELERPLPVKTPEDAFLWIRPDRIEFAKGEAPLVLWPLFVTGTLPAPFGQPPEFQRAFLEFADWLAGQDLPSELLDEARRVMGEASLLEAGLLDLMDEELQEMSDEQLLEVYRTAAQLSDSEEREFLISFLEEELHRRGIKFARKLLPCPSEKASGGEAVTREEVMKVLDGEAILYERAVCLVGSLANVGRGNDVDILVRREVPKEVFRRIAVRLGRPLSKLGAEVQIIRDDGPISSYIPLFDIVLVPSPYRDELVELAKSHSKVRLYKPTKTMKPIRIGEAQPQTIENFLKLVARHGPVGFLEGKLDGIHVQLHYGDKGWRVWTEEGQEITSILADQLKRYEPDSPCVLEGELEIWVEGKHMPRERVSGDVHARKKNSNYHITVFDCLLRGDDIHSMGYEERRKHLKAIAKEIGVKVAYPPKGFLTVLPTKPVKSLKDVEAEMKRLLKHRYLEGVVWKRRDGRYYLDGNPRGAQVKWHRSVVVTGTVVGVKETKTKGIYVYSWGIPLDDPRFRPSVEVNGKRYHVIGKTFGTARKLKIGDPIVIELEGLTVTKKGKRLSITGYAPKVLKEVDR